MTSHQRFRIKANFSSTCGNYFREDLIEGHRKLFGSTDFMGSSTSDSTFFSTCF